MIEKEEHPYKHQKELKHVNTNKRSAALDGIPTKKLSKEF